MQPDALVGDRGQPIGLQVQRPVEVDQVALGGYDESAGRR